MEIWKDIPGYENIYEVSNYGRIRTNKNKTTYTEKHGIRKWKQRVLKFKGANKNTYKTGYRVSLWKNGKSKDFLVARLVACTFLNKPLDTKLTVNHIDGNRFNNKIENLELITLSDNIKKAFENNQYKQINISIKNIETNEIKDFTSFSSCSRYLNRCRNYIKSKVEKNDFLVSKNGEKFEILRFKNVIPDKSWKSKF